MTAVPIPFSQPSALLLPLSFILINESCPYHYLQFYSFILTYYHFDISIPGTDRGCRLSGARLPGTFSARPPVRA